MMLAIHEHQGSFSDRWIKYCDEKSIPYKIVNCYDSDIIAQLKVCDGLMWHWSHDDYRDQNFARQLIFAVEKIGIKVFPNFDSCWHFDDKVGQKYLLESIDAPLVPSYVFFNKEDALKWIFKTSFPKVFKLRGGAGSLNVKLVKDRNVAIKLTQKAFRTGFPLVDRFSGLNQRFWILRRDKNFKSLIKLFKGFLRLFWQRTGVDLLQRQKGYVYFQEFVPNNQFDDRIIIIGDRAIALRRFVRTNDFKASGSGIFQHAKELFDPRAIDIAFKISKALNAQSLAFDFVYDSDNTPFIVEVSYGYAMGEAYDSCPGYWDNDLKWHVEPVNPQVFIIEDFVNSINHQD